MAELPFEKAARLRTKPDQPLKLLVSGAPGMGKTSLVNLIARSLTSHPAAIEDVNGWEVGLELDRCSKDAQQILLTYLDRMKPGHAFLGTMNLDIGSLIERF